MIDEELIQNLLVGTDIQRRAAAYKLGKLKDPAVVPILIKAYNDKDPSVRCNVLDGLRNNSCEASDYFLNSTELVRQKVIDDLIATGQIHIDQIETDLPKYPESEEANLYFDKAVELWKSMSGEKLDENWMRNIASWLSLAIHHAERNIFPEAHGLLALLLLFLNDDKRAFNHANQALHQNPHEFRAQYARILLLLKELKQVKVTPVDFLELSGKWEDALAGSFVKSLGSLANIGLASSSQSKFRNELIRLTEIFTYNCKLADTDVDEILFMADTLIELGDMLVDVPGFVNLYQPVADMSIKNLELGEQEEEVQTKKKLAFGRSLLYF